MNVINPNDPVVMMLKQIVDQYQQQLNQLAKGLVDLEEETGKAFKMLIEGNTKIFSELLGRICAIEKLIPPPVPQRSDDEGKEL